MQGHIFTRGWSQADVADKKQEGCFHLSFLSSYCWGYVVMFGIDEVEQPWGPLKLPLIAIMP